MNYYIQGSPTKAEQIKAAFKKLGINVLDFGFADKTVVYCSIGECVQYLPYSINLMNILYSHPDYQELSLTVKSNPKFKVGNWLLNKTKGITPLMVEGYNEKEGYLMRYLDTICYFGRDIIENEYRLWNFGDSKPGDILYDKAYNRIGIFENFGHHPDGGSFNDKTYCFLFIYYDIDDNEFYEKTHNDMDGYDAVPATKEQRELLFSKMKEAGYEWDSDKKELRKIKPHYDYQEIELPTKPKPNFKVCDWIVRSNGSSDIPIQVYGLKKDRYLVTNMLGSKGVLMINRQDEWHLWTIEDAIDGDVLSFDNETIVVFKDMYNAASFHSHCHLEEGIFDISTDDMPDWWRADGFKPATKEQCDLLFHKMKEAGYQWDEKKKELKKIPSHYDISNFNAGMPVLVRDSDNSEWKYVAFSHYREEGEGTFCACGSFWYQCIPFYGNEKLLGTTNMCPEEYINW